MEGRIGSLVKCLETMTCPPLVVMVGEGKQWGKNYSLSLNKILY